MPSPHIESLQRGSLLSILLKAAKRDLSLSVPLMPLYASAEVLLAGLATALIRLIYIDTPRVPVKSLLPEALQNVFVFPQTVDRKDLAFAIPLLIVGIGLFKLVTSFLSSYYMERAGYVVSTVLREELLKTVLKAPAENLLASSPSELSNRLMADTTTMQSAVSKGALGGLRDLFVLVFCICGMILIAQKFIIMVLVFLVPFVLIIRYLAKILQNYLRASVALQVDMSTHAMESRYNLLGLAAERNFWVRFKDYLGLLDRFNRITWSTIGRRTLAGPFIEYVAVLGIAILLAFKNSLGSVDVASYASLFILGAMTYRPIKNLSGVMSQYSEILITYQRLVHIWQQSARLPRALPSKQSNDAILEASDVPLKIDSSEIALSEERLCEAHNLCYVTSGEPSYVLLQNANFFVNKGEIVAFVGESGSGKTTALRLVAGVYAASKGQVKCRSWPKLATQAAYVFEGMVFENILYQSSMNSFLAQGTDGIQKPAAEKFQVAANLVCSLGLAHSSVGGEFFLDRHVGPQGAGLSGGEKARVTLARVLACEPSVLKNEQGEPGEAGEMSESAVLFRYGQEAESETSGLMLFDEPTANLDPENSERFWQTLREKVDQKVDQKFLPERFGALVVTHNRADLKYCDRFYEFSRGIVSEGTAR